MSETTDKKIPYGIQPENEARTLETTDYEKKKRSDNAWNTIADVANNISYARLFLILSLFVYAVVSYSKRDKGVDERDLSIFVLTLIIVILLSFFTAFAQKIYRMNWGSILLNPLKFIKENLFLLFIISVAAILIFIFVKEKLNILELYKNLISNLI